MTVTVSGELIFRENTVLSYRIVKRSQCAREKQGCKNDVAIFIFLTSFLFVRSTEGIGKPDARTL